MPSYYYPDSNSSRNPSPYSDYAKDPVPAPRPRPRPAPQPPVIHNGGGAVASNDYYRKEYDGGKTY